MNDVFIYFVQKTAIKYRNIQGDIFVKHCFGDDIRILGTRYVLLGTK